MTSAGLGRVLALRSFAGMDGVELAPEQAKGEDGSRSGEQTVGRGQHPEEDSPDWLLGEQRPGESEGYYAARVLEGAARARAVLAAPQHLHLQQLESERLAADWLRLSSASGVPPSCENSRQIAAWMSAGLAAGFVLRQHRSAILGGAPGVAPKVAFAAAMVLGPALAPSVLGDFESRVLVVARRTLAAPRWAAMDDAR